MAHDREVYVDEADLGAIVSWLEGLLGPLTYVDSGRNVILHAREGRVAVILTPGMARGPFTSVCLRGELSWPTDAALAREAAAALGVEVRCDPGELPHHGSDTFLRIRGTEEERFDWLDEA
ncbi:MAG: hypothetical protein Q8P18_02045 [Pseudomonadota bacterium]|nr:hypothetical protein [Pseudomonadota bacterium]